VFYLYRPPLSREDEDDTARAFGGVWRRVRGRWWYKLAHVCQRWRNIILGSASYLGVSLVCKNGTPVADMLAHSPPLPLDIDYFDNITTEDEEGTILALKQRHRVRRVCLRMPVTILQKVIVAIDEEYPILEYLVIVQIGDYGTVLILPETLQAPHLCHLSLSGIALPIGSRLLTTVVSVITLGLFVTHPSAYPQPNTLLRCFSSMPQLETLTIGFLFATNHDVEELLTTHTPIMTPVTLPNLRHFRFQGACAYLEALVHRVTAPRLEKLQIEFFNQRTFSVPRLVQVMNTRENLSFDSAKFVFTRWQVYVQAYPRGELKMYAFSIAVNCWHLDRQVCSMAQIFNSLGQLFSAVKHLTLEYTVHIFPFEGHYGVDRTDLRNLLRPFSKVKTLCVDDGLVKELSRCLRSDDGELPLDLLPELQELTYSESGDNGDSLTSFIDARENEGRPITLVRRSPSPT
jgi:hypothetical protein